mgnify:CR=1 FL=1
MIPAWLVVVALTTGFILGWACAALLAAGDDGQVEAFAAGYRKGVAYCEGKDEREQSDGR